MLNHDVTSQVEKLWHQKEHTHVANISVAINLCDNILNSDTDLQWHVMLQFILYTVYVMCIVESFRDMAIWGSLQLAPLMFKHRLQFLTYEQKCPCQNIKLATSMILSVGKALSVYWFEFCLPKSSSLIFFFNLRLGKLYTFLTIQVKEDKDCNYGKTILKCCLRKRLQCVYSMSTYSTHFGKPQWPICRIIYLKWHVL